MNLRYPEQGNHGEKRKRSIDGDVVCLLDEKRVQGNERCGEQSGYFVTEFPGEQVGDKDGTDVKQHAQ